MKDYWYRMCELDLRGWSIKTVRFWSVYVGIVRDKNTMTPMALIQAPALIILKQAIPPKQRPLFGRANMVYPNQKNSYKISRTKADTENLFICGNITPPFILWMNDLGDVRNN